MRAYLCCGSFRHGHVSGIGVNDISCSVDYAHVTFPEDKVARFKPVEIAVEADVPAQRQFLHIRIARAGASCGKERNLYNPRTVKAPGCFAAP